MPNKKITQLSFNTNPTLEDVLPLVNNGETKQITASRFADLISPYIQTVSVLPQLGFIITPDSINQDVELPVESTVRYFGPLTIGNGYVLTVPETTTLIIL
jgi:hypothetical protein